MIFNYTHCPFKNGDIVEILDMPDDMRQVCNFVTGSHVAVNDSGKIDPHHEGAHGEWFIWVEERNRKIPKVSLVLGQYLRKVP